MGYNPKAPIEERLKWINETLSCSEWRERMPEADRSLILTACDTILAGGTSLSRGQALLNLRTYLSSLEESEKKKEPYRNLCRGYLVLKWTIRTLRTFLDTHGRDYEYEASIDDLFPATYQNL